MIITRQILSELIPKDETIVFIPNPGNAGDACIAYGTHCYFKHNHIQYETGNINALYSNKTIVYGGGGNLISLWSQCKNFLLRNAKNNKIVVLPHTIEGIDDVLQYDYIQKNVTFICRETISYEYVKRYVDNVFIDHDMAFSISDVFFNRFTNNECYDTLNCFRIDNEKTDIIIPPDNIDLSINAMNGLMGEWMHNNYLAVQSITHSFCSKISKYYSINTNRLHVAIIGAILGKNVLLYQNSYFKNKAVYDYSIKDAYKNVTFIEGNIINKNDGCL